jgi:hypothetical protein
MGKDLKSIFATQMQSDFSSVPLEKMGANFTFLQPDTTTFEHPTGIKVLASKHSHRGDAYGYRIEEGGKLNLPRFSGHHKKPNV